MNGRVVCDAPALVALLLDGRWVTSALTGSDLVAPSLVGFETATSFAVMSSRV